MTIMTVCKTRCSLWGMGCLCQSEVETPLRLVTKYWSLILILDPGPWSLVLILGPDPGPCAFAKIDAGCEGGCLFQSGKETSDGLIPNIDLWSWSLTMVLDSWSWSLVLILGPWPWSLTLARGKGIVFSGPKTNTNTIRFEKFGRIRILFAE